MTSEPHEASAALVERRLSDAIFVIQDDHCNRFSLATPREIADEIARAVLPIIDDLIAEKQAEVLREVGNGALALEVAELSGRLPREARAILRAAQAILASRDTGRARLDTRTDRTEERDEHDTEHPTPGG